MTWWCSARGTPWEWTWRPYPGVWVVALALIAAYMLGRSWLRRRDLEEPGGTSGRRARAFFLGAALFWLASDWPLGPLGAGYLVSVHIAQYILYTMVVAPLFVYAMPPEILRAMTRPRWAARLTRLLTRPLIAFLVFNVVLVTTHLPAVVDQYGVTQIGSFAADMAWLASGVLFWWQVLAPLPELEPLSYPGRIVFLLINVFIPTVPAAFLTFADYPLYAVYELAPRIAELSAVQDQRLAGLTMKIVGGFIILGTASVLFFKWYGMERRDEGRA